MKDFLFSMLAASIVINFSGCINEDESQHSQTTWDIYHLDEEELRHSKIAAIDGDAEAAAAVAHHYFIESDGYTDGIEWAIIGARSGSQSMKNRLKVWLNQQFLDELRELSQGELKDIGNQ